MEVALSRSLNPPSSVTRVLTSLTLQNFSTTSRQDKMSKIVVTKTSKKTMMRAWETSISPSKSPPRKNQVMTIRRKAKRSECAKLIPPIVKQ